MNVQSRSNRFVVGAALLTLAAWSPIGGSSNSAAAEGGGSITFGVPWEVDSFDPTFSTQRVGRLVFKNMCESLFGVDDQLEVYPVLAAEMPDISDDGLSMTIPLRSGLRFSDATEFDAEAVKVSLERHMTAEGSRRASELFFLDSVEVVDNMTVKLNLKEPYVPAAAVLADRSGTIMSPTRLAELNDEFGSAPSCVAPFKFAEWSQGNFFALERDPEYYAADSVAIDRVVFRLIEDASIRMANLRTGEVDMTEVSHRDIAHIVADDSLVLLSTDSVGWLDI
jgi:peptide/nickel transport system substrate-binding protein